MIAYDFCKQFASYANLLSIRVASHPKKTAITFLGDGENVTDCCTYQELESRVLEVAAWLTQNVAPRSRVLLSFNPGLDFVYAFLGCLYAGVTAVPAYPPRRRGNLGRLEAIAINAEVAVVLSANDILADIGPFDSTPYFKKCTWKAIEDIRGGTETWVAPTIHQSDLAFLQYTSGSTGLPKGVSVSHQNILHNVQVIKFLFGQLEGKCIMAGWLPMYHDMGLIGTLLHPLSLGGMLVCMPPMAFLQKPIRWLKMVSDFKATISGGPNFAYDLCVARTTPEERAKLDLSNWRVAFNGAEPIRYDTMRGFDAIFAPHGFLQSTFSPCYGMAETTLMVTGSGPDSPWCSIEVDSASLRNNLVVPIAPNSQRSADVNIQRLVSSGCPYKDIDVQIVDPSTLLRCKENEVGEIWIRSRSVAQGYWGRTELTKEIFHAKINKPQTVDSKLAGARLDPSLYDHQYLRTGDLGFKLNNELYITGRFKDLIILNGENHYPQDLENSIESSHCDLKAGHCVAFAWQETLSETDVSSALDDQGYAERVYVAQEINREAMRSFNFDEIVSAAYQACWDEHQVAMDGFLLVRPGGVPKTTSGKLQRQTTRKLFEEGTLPILASWRRDRDGAPVAKRASEKTTFEAQTRGGEPTAKDLKSTRELEMWLQTRVASYAGLPIDNVERNQPIAAYGLKSLSIVRLAGELSLKLGKNISPTLAFDYPTIEDICKFLVLGESVQPNAEPSTSKDSARFVREDPIAVVGMACRMPGADSVSDYFSLLHRGNCVIGPWPQSRNSGSYKLTESTDNSNAKRSGLHSGGFLKRVDQFDPLFFGISPREADEMDPQQRLMLEVCYEAFEHAGISSQLKNRQRTGVFIGVSGNEYARAMLQAGVTVSGHTATGNSMAMVANRISYVFNLRGPSFAIDTACSSSLVAVHLAAESLLRGECELAVAGGVTLQSSFDISQSLEAAGMLSPTGSSKAFSAGADGFVRGEGCGAVLLKRLSQAQRDGDRIFCLLRGSAVNQDGRSNGLTAPNGLAQQDVIRQALKRSGLKPQDIDYIEAHGTGTELGDPIEMGAIASVFVTPDCPRAKPLLVGSVKTNIGHLEGAAGIAGLIKTALSLHHKELPPHLHFTEPSPHIQWHPEVQIPTQLTPWPQQDSHIRRAGVSSFGFGGTNAHVILEEAPVLALIQPSTETPSAPTLAAKRTYWLKVSAKSNEALAELAIRYAKAFTLDSHQEDDHSFELENASLEEISYVGNVGRSDFNHRAVVEFETRQELVVRLLEVATQARASTSTVSIFIGSSGNEVWPLAMNRYVQGEEIPWDLLFANKSAYQRTISLPTYPFQRQRCWFRTENLRAENLKPENLEPENHILEQEANGRGLQPVALTSQALRLRQDGEGVSGLLGSRLDVAGDSIIYEVDLSGCSSLADHRLRGESLFPAAGYLELAVSAVKATFAGNISVEDLRLEQALRWSAERPPRIQVVLHEETCRILSRQSEGWREHARCRIVESGVSDASSGYGPIQNVLSSAHPSSASSTTTTIGEMVTKIDIHDHYARCGSVGLQYSGEFRSLRSLSTLGRSAFGEVCLPTLSEGSKPVDLEASYNLHPALLDGCFQSIVSLMGSEGGLWLPVSIGSYRLHFNLNQKLSTDKPLRFVTRMDEASSSDQRLVQIQIFTSDNLLCAEVQRLALQRVGSEPQVPSDTVHTLTHETWVPRFRVTENSIPPRYDATELGGEVLKVRNSLVDSSGYAIDLPSRGRLDVLSVKWIVNAFIDFFGPIQLGRSFVEKDLPTLAAVAPDKKSLFFRLFDILSENGFLTREPDGWKVVKAFTRTDVKVLSDQLLQLHPRMAPEILLLRRCGPVLSDVIRGDVDPLPILFSDKLAGSAVDVYTRAAGAQVLNGLLVEAVSRIAERLTPGRTLRVLEIGAGTGATTRLLLSRLPKDRIAYTFTDIARGFLASAKEEYSPANSEQPIRVDGPNPLQPFNCVPLNIELDPLSQGFAAESYDVIVAANVLHATASLDLTLSNVEQLLAPGGQLLLLEGTHPVSWMDLTFGLTDGWWRFAGRDATRDYPLISPECWQEKLHQHRFKSTDVIEPNSSAMGSRNEQLSSPHRDEEPQCRPAENVLIIATKDIEDQFVRQDDSDEVREFLIVAKEPSCADALSRALVEGGSRCSTIQLTSLGTAEVVEKLQTFWNLVPAMNPSKMHIVFLVDESHLVSDIALAEMESQSLVCQLVGVIQSILKNHANSGGTLKSPRLTLVARHLIPTAASASESLVTLRGLQSCGLFGVMRTLALEHPQWCCRSIDYETTEPSDWLAIVDELNVRDQELDEEPEIAIRAGIRYGRRLVPHPELSDLPRRKVLRIVRRGDLESLRLDECDCESLNADDVEIAVHASGLNFRDVLNALGRYPEVVPLGSECAGIVSRIGAAVTSCAVGDRVVAIAPDSFATLVVAPASIVCPMPASLDFKTAASLPVAYLTASVALQSLANLKPNQNVLIHAATGGVGLAAISICRLIGANVFVTASLPKHAYLYSLGLNQVFDSRAEGYARAILEATQGRGVDVVLNLLDESFADENLRVIGPNGFYIDVTKPTLDIEQKIQQQRPDVAYHHFDLAQLLRDNPATMKASCIDLMLRVDRGELSRLPIESYDIQNASQAFRKMQRATHIGKIVLSQSPASKVNDETSPTYVRSDAAYVVVGGLGDIGLLTAGILSENKAGLIALVGRSSPTPQQQIEIDRLSRHGQNIMVLLADASDPLQLDLALQKVREKLPIVGVVHSAGILSDAMLSEQSSASIAKVWRSKATIGWNLHRLTANDHLELFVVYSSLASVLGAPGQANHAAANAFLDGLVVYRNGNSMPGSHVDWGPWSEIGEAARKSTSSRDDLRGAGFITPPYGATVIDQILRNSRFRLTVSPLSVEMMPDRLQKQRLFDFLRKQNKIATELHTSLAVQLMQLPQSSRQEWMIEKVTQTLARILGIENRLDISSETTFVDLGLDSLTGIEFIDALNRQWLTKLPTSAVYDHPTVSKITKNLILQLSTTSRKQVTGAPIVPETEITINQGATLSDKGADGLDDKLTDLLAELNQWI